MDGIKLKLYLFIANCENEKMAFDP